MSSQNLDEIMKIIPKLDVESMEIQDQALFLINISNFAESMKPLIVKYADKTPKESKFLIKL